MSEPRSWGDKVLVQLHFIDRCDSAERADLLVLKTDALLKVGCAAEAVSDATLAASIRQIAGLPADRALVREKQQS